MTTTGYATADFDRWPPFSRLLLVGVMFFGGCAGSTGGGIKHVRLLLLWRHIRLQVFPLLHPKAVRAVKLDGANVAPEVMQAVLGFFSLYLDVVVLATLAVCAQGVDSVTGATAVAATLNNVGPGLGAVGPMAHFGHLPDFSKLILSLWMLVGRLVLFTLMVLLFPDFWKETRKPLVLAEAIGASPIAMRPDTVKLVPAVPCRFTGKRHSGLDAVPAHISHPIRKYGPEPCRWHRR